VACQKRARERIGVLAVATITTGIGYNRLVLGVRSRLTTPRLRKFRSHLLLDVGVRSRVTTPDQCDLQPLQVGRPDPCESLTGQFDQSIPTQSGTCRLSTVDR
jgi:hypothetical protein